jgi:L-lactate dehydrogenase complex protein LldG
MNSRDKILAAVRKNKPETTVLPDVPCFEIGLTTEEKLTKFNEMLQKIGGKSQQFESVIEINKFIEEQYKDIKNIASNIKEIQKQNIDLTNVNKPHQLENVDLAIIRGEVGVAENGAVWIDGSYLVHHALPFITQHLIIVIYKSKIVENMHLAYQQLNLSECKYGVFIAGPSKTADIEQSLVIGAHGSRSLLVMILND